MARLVLLFGAALLVAACSTGTAISATPAPTSTPRPTPTPVSGIGNCPTDSPLTVSQFTDADPACFGGTEVAIRGWLDSPPATGVEPPFVEPGWIAYPAPNLPSLWEIQPVGADHFCPDTAAACPWFFLHIDPASGLTLDFPARWLIVTGHTQDPAAETCQFVYGEEWTEAPLDDALAVESCRTHLVIVSFRDAP